MDFVQKLYFAIAVLGCIGVGDILFKLKRPLLLKITFIIILLSMITSALIFSFKIMQLAFCLTMLKAIMSSGFLFVFYFLYFKELKYAVLFYSTLIIPLSIFAAWYNYTHFDYHQIAFLNGNVGMDTNLSVELPIFLRFIRIASVTFFIILILYIWYRIYYHFKEENIYYERIRVWTNFVLFLSFLIIFANVPFKFIRENFYVSNGLTIAVYFYLSFLILYRPDFLNRSSLRIAFGKQFNPSSSNEISELAFINEFFTKVYYKDPNASLDHLAKILGVSSGELYRFLYNNYSMTFNDLVNKHRINYFLDLIKKDEYKNFTIDALAKEVGFSSRQHLHKPFKKFHGGNPSDLIDALHN